MPVDPNPNPGGNVELSKAGPGQPPIARVLSGEALAAAKADGRCFHMAHMATCPKRPKPMASRPRQRGRSRRHG